MVWLHSLVPHIPHHHVYIERSPSTRAILQAPFTPFIVLFCNVILHCSPSDTNALSDLQALSDFVASIESCRTISEGADKLYKMCHLFLQVAKLYIEAKAKDSSAHQAPSSQPDSAQQGFYQPDGSVASEPTFDSSTMTQFDPYLSALGLMPNSAWPMANFAQEGPVAAGLGGMTAQGQSFDGGFPAGLQSDNTVQNWFSGSRYLMNLMEDDIQMPDFNNV